MKTKHDHEAKNLPDEHMLTTNAYYGSSIKDKLKKVVRPTVIILLVWGLAIALVWIMKLAN